MNKLSDRIPIPPKDLNEYGVKPANSSWPTIAVNGNVIDDRVFSSKAQTEQAVGISGSLIRNFRA